MERSAWPKNLSSSRKHAIKELLHGQNRTKKLRDLFDAHSQTGNNTGQPLFAEDLIVNALRSFSNTLSLSSSSESYEVFPVPTNACVMSEVSEENESINTPVPRKTSETWTEVISNFMDDGFSWRNYVETWLQNSEFPRYIFTNDIHFLKYIS
ncbi:probable WRKY transcription factor 70 [Syzygium oleosum]|uniref:probable WRKY transcription factor 70 n=1 Tax=Syzygium oleosum TaxID=219896 RepID=UPI0024BB76F3|nr:probable WRKY transcription factor 70 [Syzygium oleosum]